MSDTLNRKPFALIQEGPMRDHIMDGAKASPVIAYLGAWFSGVSISDWATFAAFVYTCILIFDKLRNMGAFKGVGQWLRLPKRPS